MFGAPAPGGKIDADVLYFILGSDDIISGAASGAYKI